jgi:type IV pilus assembly protein PilA
MSLVCLRRRKCGFTLIELLVVVLILAILMAVALPLYLAAVSDSARKTCRANMQTIAHAEQAYRVKYRQGYSPTIDPGLLPDLQAAPVCPSSGTYSVTVDTPAGGFTVNCSDASHGSFVPGDGS